MEKTEKINEKVEDILAFFRRNQIFLINEGDLGYVNLGDCEVSQPWLREELTNLLERRIEVKEKITRIYPKTNWKMEIEALPADNIETKIGALVLHVRSDGKLLGYLTGTQIRDILEKRD